MRDVENEVDDEEDVAAALDPEEGTPDLLHHFSALTVGQNRTPNPKRKRKTFPPHYPAVNAIHS
jgi:hypothetical protein